MATTSRAGQSSSSSSACSGRCAAPWTRTTGRRSILVSLLQVGRADGGHGALHGPHEPRQLRHADRGHARPAAGARAQQTHHAPLQRHALVKRDSASRSPGRRRRIVPKDRRSWSLNLDCHRSPRRSSRPHEHQQTRNYNFTSCKLSARAFLSNSLFFNGLRLARNKSDQ